MSPRALFVCAIVAALGAQPVIADEPGLVKRVDELPPFDYTLPEVDPRARLTSAPSVDPRAGPWACNTDTLIDEHNCVLAGRTVRLAAGDVRPANERAVRTVGQQVCARLVLEASDVRLRPKLKEHCDGLIEEIIPLCASGPSELTDVAGHFGADHAACYASFLALVREVRAISQTYAPCCACLVDAGCAATFASCAADVAACKRPSKTQGCGADRCQNTCRATQLLAPRSSP